MDHDRLPPEIQRLWTDNGALWFKIKELFEQLKGMESAPACDRYEYLKLLDEAYKKYRANLQAYDDYKPRYPSTDVESQGEGGHDPYACLWRHSPPRTHHPHPVPGHLRL